MRFVKSTLPAAVTVPLALTAVAPKDLNPSDAASVRGVAKSIAGGVMSYYTAKSDPSILIGDLPDPYYWWEAGAMWGMMLDYYHYTGDATYNDLIIESLLAPVNTGPAFDFVPPEHRQEEGNDDLSFWGFAVLAAAERNFPQPDASKPAWLDMAANIFESLASRWNDTHCGGGLPWQMYPDNPNGMNYKNSVSNGGFFQLAARLARATGDDKYKQWAEKVWDWSVGVGFIDANFNVYDGADARDECRTTNYLSFTYSTGIYLYGAAALFDHTSDTKWSDRAKGLVNAASEYFFWPEKNTTSVLYEPACETVDRCNVDMLSHKGYLSRFLWQSTLLVPELSDTVNKLLSPSALAAASTCTGGASGTECGQKWYVGGFDGSTGLGQQMCALETVQGLLVSGVGLPLKGADIHVVRERSWPSSAAGTKTTRRL